MATYIMLMKLTEQGAADITDAKKGRNAGKKAAAAVGVTWKKSYLVMGEYDVVVIVEAPDEEAMARFSLLGGLSGAVKTTTMRAFTESEADELLSSLAQMAEKVA
jgi:uncharacterized protein with GYD domain